MVRHLGRAIGIVQPTVICRIHIFVHMVTIIIHILVGIPGRPCVIGITISFSLQFQIIDAFKDIRQRSSLLQAIQSIVFDIHFIQFTGFGGDKDYPIRRTVTVNRTGCCIFQNRNRFNIFRVDRIETTLHTINNDQRVCIVECTYTTDLYLGIIISRLTGNLADKSTGYIPLQHGTGIGISTSFGFRQIKTFYGTGQIHLLLSTVPHNYYLIQQLGIFFQIYHKPGLAFYLDRLGQVSHIGDGKRAVGRKF